MRAALILAALAGGPAPAQSEPPVARYRVTVVERTAGGTLTATVTATRRRYTTSWILECKGAGDRRRREPSTYRGTSVAEDRWLEHRAPAGRFTIALGEPRLWMANLRGCPAVGQPRIERLP
jgi:hypothetical protein